MSHFGIKNVDDGSQMHASVCYQDIHICWSQIQTTEGVRSADEFRRWELGLVDCRVISTFVYPDKVIRNLHMSNKSRQWMLVEGYLV